MKLLHDLPAPGHDRQRRAARHRLAERGEIGRDAEMGLRAAERDPEARDHLVHDEERPVPAAEIPDAFEVARHRHEAAAVAEDGLHHHRRDPVRMRPEQAFQDGEVVPRRDEHVLDDVRDLAEGARDDVRRLAGAEALARVVAHQRPVDPAVVVAFELQDEGPPREGAGQAMHELDDLAAARAERDPLRGGDGGLDPLGHGDLQLVLGAVGERALRGAVRGGDERGVGVAQDHGSPGRRVVDVPVAVGVLEARTYPAREVQGNGGGPANGARDTPGQGPAGALEEGSGAVERAHDGSYVRVLGVNLDVPDILGRSS